MVEWNHRGMHASLDATGMTLRVSDELDRETQFARVAEVDGFDPLDALAKDVVRPHLDLIRDGREDGELVGGVEAPDVVGRVGLGVPGLLRFAQCVRHRHPLRGHPPEDVVRGPVDHCGHTFDPVGLEVGPKRADQRDAAADRGFEVDVDVFLRGLVEQLGPVPGHHDLVGGDDMLAGLDRALHVRAHRLVTARHLDDDLDLGVVEDIGGVGRQDVGRDLDRAALAYITDEHLAQAELDPRATRKLRTPRQHPIGDLRADGAKADEADVEGAGGHRRLFSLRWP